MLGAMESKGSGSYSGCIRVRRAVQAAVVVSGVATIA